MTQTADKITPNRSIPPLENGDHLTLAEFERRYNAMPNLKRAELIEGKVYVSPPTSIAGHSNPHAMLATAALPAGDLAKGLTQLQQGLASPEHAAFVEALKAKANR
jgi:hypothetical protein